MTLPAGYEIKADEKRLLDLDDKHKKGKITQAEFKEYKRLLQEKRERDELAQAQAAGPQPWLISNAELAALIGVTGKTICEWAKLGMPKVRQGTYDFRKVFPWWMENIISRDDDDDGTTTALKRDFLREKIRKARVEADEAEGKVWPVDEIHGQWCRRVAELRQALLTLAVRLPALLEGKPISEMRNMIQKEASTMLETYSRGSRYCPPLEEAQIQEVITQCLPKSSPGTPRKKRGRPRK